MCGGRNVSGTGCVFMELVHAEDERIPVEAVEFGTSAIRRLVERFGQATPATARARGAAQARGSREDALLCLRARGCSLLALLPPPVGRQSARLVHG